MNKREQIENLKKLVERLGDENKKLSNELHNETTIPFYFGEQTIGCDAMLLPKYEEVPMRKVVILLMEHLGLVLKKNPPQLKHEPYALGPSKQGGKKP